MSDRPVSIEDEKPIPTVRPREVRLIETLATDLHAEHVGPGGAATFRECYHVGCSEARAYLDVRAATPDNAGRSPIDVERLIANKTVEVAGHLVVHVAACPCPEQQAEVARLSESTGSEEGR